MTSISEIARDPRKALKDLEKGLGVGEGTLMREMQALADEIGDWTQHIPYTLAAGYYDSPTSQERFRSHVDGCTYCQHLLESLHPTNLDTVAFVREATRAVPPEPSRHRPARSLSLAIAASILVTALASLLVVPGLQSAGLLHNPAGDSYGSFSVMTLGHRGSTTVLVEELRRRPTRLSQLETSNLPAERFLAAKYFFAADKPELAYQQIGEGLQLAGIHPVDARKITAVADLPSDDSAAADIAEAAQQLPRLQADAQPDDPADFLEIAKAQAKLGLHKEALASIHRYLQTQHLDDKTLAEFSSVAPPKSVPAPFATLMTAFEPTDAR